MSEDHPDQGDSTREPNDDSAQHSDDLSVDQTLDRSRDHVAATGHTNRKTTPSGTVDQDRHIQHRETLPLDFGDYRLIRKIGEGGMGVVYEAEQKSLGNRRLAIKTIKHLGGFNDGAVKRFRTEVQAVAQLEHRHIVPVYHLGVESGLHYYVMKLIEGDNLRELVSALRDAISKRHRSTRAEETTEPESSGSSDSTHRSGWSKGDTLASQDVIEKISVSGSTAHPEFVRNFVKMGIQAATALHYVHQHGVVHRDVKPANLILDVDGDVWLTDFGLALIRDTPDLTAPGDLVGTYQYMSPEQAMGSKRVIVDHRSDIYSLGVTLYELLTLQRAFPGRNREQVLRAIQFENPEPVRKIAPRVPQDLETIVMKAMAKDPNARFQSAEAMAEELKRFQEGKPLTVRPPSHYEKIVYWARTHREIVTTTAAAFVVALVASVIMGVMAWNGMIQAEEVAANERAQKEFANALYKRADGMRLGLAAALAVNDDPTRALALAVEGAKYYEGAETNDSIIEAIDIGQEARSMSGHTARLGGVDFSVDGSRIITTARPDDFGQLQEPEPAIIWDTDSGEELGRLRHTSTITSAVFSPDRGRILTASSPVEDPSKRKTEGAVPKPPCLWDQTTQRRLVEFKDCYLFEAHRAAFDSAGRRVVLPMSENRAGIFDCISGSLLFPLEGHTDLVVLATFSPRGDLVATLSKDHTVRLWKAGSGEQVGSIQNPYSPPSVIAYQLTNRISFSPDGNKILTVSPDDGVRLWDTRSKPAERLNPERVPASSAFFCGNGDLIATYGLVDANNMKKVAIRSAFDARSIDELSVDRLVRMVSISPDHRFAGILHLDYLPKFQIFDMETKQLLAEFGGAIGNINNLAFSPDSSKIATVADDRLLRLWHVQNGRQRSTFPDMHMIRDDLTAVSSPDGRVFSFVAGAPSTVCIVHDTSKSTNVLTIESQVKWSSTPGDQVLGIEEDQILLRSLKDGSSGKSAFVIGSPQQAAIDRLGQRVAVFQGGEDVMLWIPRTGQRMRLPAGEGTVNHLGFTPDGKKLFFKRADGMIRIWEAETGRELKTINHGGKLRDLQFSANSKVFCVTTEGGELTVYDTDRLEKIRDVGSEQNSRNTEVSISNDGSELLTLETSESNALTVWNIETGEAIATRDLDGATGVVFHPAQKEALVWSAATGGFVWQYPDDNLVPLTDRPISTGCYSQDGETVFLATRRPGRGGKDKDLEAKWASSPGPCELLSFTSGAGEPLKSVDLPGLSIYRMHAIGEQRLALGANRVHRVVNYGMSSHRPISELNGHNGPVSSILYRADSRHILTTSLNPEVSVWDLQSGKRVAQWNDHGSPILASDIGSKDKTLLTGAYDGTCCIWRLHDDAAAAPATQILKLSDSRVWHVALDEKEETGLALSSDDRLHLFSTGTGERLSVDIKTDSVDWAEFSADGKSLLVLPKLPPDSQSHRVEITELASGEVTALRYDGPIRSSHFHPEAKEIVTAFRVIDVKATNKTPSNRVDVRELATGRILHDWSLENHQGLNATFDPTGQYIYISGIDVGQVWRTDGRRWLTVKDHPSSLPGSHRHQPFTQGDAPRLMTWSVPERKFRDYPVRPVEDAEKLLPRGLTEFEKQQFLITQ